MKLSKYFNSSEFECKCNNCKLVEIDSTLLAILDEIREWSKGPIYISSGYRCPEYNARIGGATKSKHLLGLAADISSNNKTAKEIFNYLNNKYPTCLGLAYSDKHGFTHIDTYGDRARRWTY